MCQCFSVSLAHQQWLKAGFIQLKAFNPNRIRISRCHTAQRNLNAILVYVPMPV